MSLALAPHRLTPRPWRALTDVEWADLRVWLPHGDPDAVPTRGRPRVDLRRTVDAIFWVAASSGPWKALPEELGKWGTAHRALARWARAGVLETLLTEVCRPEAPGPLRGLGYWLARSFRRMARIVSAAAMALVKNVLGLVDAWPAWPLLLPNANLSKIARRGLDTVHSALKLNAMLFARANTRDEREPLYKSIRLVLRAAKAGWDQMRLGVCGNRHQWRLK